MITEDYVGFEVAKLLKEKRFDENCTKVYINKELRDVITKESIKECTNCFNHYLYPGDATAPTLQMAFKWLREVHNLYINIFVTWKDKIPHYQWSIDNLITQDTIYDTPCLEKYEEAVEAAIKYCLTNLI